ncbi:uncharacterized protein BDR25DRAFT_339793 [Lindgomyces ingoldianus]|uniref:Uncharacterized protein n=1 Tax=Lindgomyces ingoldianus TaxID=673940 RepID=A0ACB6RAP6_9PLEO|nr:uncharacterized protein BDR25DRAFT_339793 [Lindgomyces ingoldianus]KAF2475795.1 hypothetical protein BDR25DRAFT_339793 [Lindgomyces ingoldianus]
MPLALSVALPADSGRIAEIHMAAFGPNAMLRAQFPTPAVRDALQRSIESKALADILDPKTTVLVVRDLDQAAPGGKDQSDQSTDVRFTGDEHDEDACKKGTIISFAKWAHPVAEDEEYEEPPWHWPEGTALEVLNEWTKQMEEAQEKVVGSTPCYRLNFMGTDPVHERRGAASMMLRWGLEQCRKHNAPAYLESTIEAAPFYEKNGFIAIETLSLKLQDSYGCVETYKEIGFLYRPQKA